MRIISVFAMFIILSGNIVGQNICSNDALFLEMKKEIRAEFKDTSSDIISVFNFSHFINSLYYSNYKQAIDTFYSKGLSCTDIDSWSIVETYSLNSLLHKSFVTARTNSGVYHLTKIDFITDETIYLGVCEVDYMSMMANIIIRSSDKGIGEDYIIKMAFDTQGSSNYRIAANSDVYEMNAIFIVEELIKSRD